MGALLQGKAPGPGREHVPSGAGPGLRAVPGVARAGGDSDVVGRGVLLEGLCALELYALYWHGMFLAERLVEVGT
jgi:hypothetical protein